MNEASNPLKSYFVSRVNFNKSFKNIEIQVKSEKSEKSSVNSGQKSGNRIIFQERKKIFKLRSFAHEVKKKRFLSFGASLTK